MVNSLSYSSRHKVGVKAKKEKKLRKQSEKEKEKVVSADGDEVGIDTRNPDSDMGMDNGKEKSPQELEEENLDLAMENNDWAASPGSSLFPYEDNEGSDSENK